MQGWDGRKNEACNVTSSKLDLCLIEVTAVAAALGYLVSYIFESKGRGMAVVQLLHDPAAQLC